MIRSTVCRVRLKLKSFLFFSLIHSRVILPTNPFVIWGNIAYFIWLLRKLIKLMYIKPFSTVLATKLGLNQFSSVQSVMSDSLWHNELQRARPPCPSPTPRVYPNSCPLSWWCHLTVSSSVIPFSSYHQSFPTSGSFQMSQLFASGGQSIGVSASTSVLPVNTQDWFPLAWTGWISLKSKGLSRAFSNTTVQKHQFFSAQLSL